jgi:hypothetical protein
MTDEQYAGQGGSYRIDEAGNKQLIERTAEASATPPPSAPTPPASAPATAGSFSSARVKRTDEQPVSQPAAPDLATAADNSTAEKE